MDRFKAVVYSTGEACLDSLLWYHMPGLWWQYSRCFSDCIMCRITKSYAAFFFYINKLNWKYEILLIFHCKCSNSLTLFDFPVTLPTIQFDLETGNYTVHQTQRIPLELSAECPICTTAMVFDEWVFVISFTKTIIIVLLIFILKTKNHNSNNNNCDHCSETIFADPDAAEEELATSLITIGTCNGEICFILKPGGSSINDKQFEACLNLAFGREKSICQLISSIIKDE